MLTKATIVVFIFSICMLQGSNPCPAACTCTDNRKEVQCSGKQLNAIPNIQGSNITTLDVSFNNISLIHPNDFGNWGGQLKFCYLNYNYINKVEISVFRRLPELTHIHLDYNLISQIDQHTFEENHKLSKLILNGNTLTLPNDTEFLNVPSLRWIELENCSISYLNVNLFKNMSKLVVIRLSNNLIEQLQTELFSHLKSLRYLHLEGNNIKEIDPYIFKSNHKLEWLYLRNNPLNQNQFSRNHFLHVPSIILLDISFCNISQISNSCFTNLHNLLGLKLNNNVLKSFNVIQIPKNLEVLDISRNSITTINARKEIIRHTKNIKYLDLTHNEFICDCHLYDMWLWCATLRSRPGGMSYCDDFCPAFKPMTCKGQYSQNDKARNTSKHFSSRNPETNQKYVNHSSEGINSDYETNGTQDNVDIETIDDMDVDTDIANDTIGKYQINDESESSDLGSTDEKDQVEKRMWGIILYSCIGVMGGMCLIGAVVLGTDMFLNYRKSRGEKNCNSLRSSMRHVKMELMDTAADSQETRPLTHSQGFDFVSMPTNANITIQHGNSGSSSVQS
ncbi:leucine-rich repeat-containing protein 15-like [Zootermopsis nevadensis]|nr:leucine-rich repeat-containing protein 15-like [Zootermopsis nevadensis]